MLSIFSDVKVVLRHGTDGRDGSLWIFSLENRGEKCDHVTENSRKPKVAHNSRKSFRNAWLFFQFLCSSVIAS